MPTFQEITVMAVHSVKVMPDGRIQIPAQLRREMNLSGGETLNLELRDGTLSVRRPSKTLEAIRAMLAPYLGPDVDLQAELKAMRVEDAARD
jgi:AbrB family looped-hinge helix DNA binding protein